MRKLTIALLGAIALLVMAVACGDDDNGDTDASPTETASTASARPSPTKDGATSPTGSGGDKTPSGETPDETTPAPTEAGPQPTPASVGTPATVIEDPNYFSDKYPDQSFDESECVFSPVTYVATCGSDKYAPNPPLTGQDIQCFLWSVDGTPVAIRCTSQEPLLTIYYEIQG